MAVKRLSQITAASSPPAPTDQIVGVQGGVNDVLFSAAQLGVPGRTVFSTNTTYFVSILSGTVVSGSGYTYGTYGTIASPIALTSGSGAGAAAIINCGVSTATLTGGTLYTDGFYYYVPMTGGSGSGMFASITVSGGAVTKVSVILLGTLYAVNDTLSAAAANIGGTGSGFTWKINTIGVTVIQPTTQGGGYVVTDVLSAATANIGGTGSGFTFTLTAIGANINSGLVATSPFLNLQHAFDYLGSNIDGGGHGILIQFADGIHDGAQFNSCPPGLSMYTLQGNPTNHTTAVLTDTWPQGGAFACIDIEVQVPASFNLLWMTLNVINGGACLSTDTSTGGTIYPNNIQFAGTGNDQIGMYSSGAILNPGFDTFSGNVGNIYVAGTFNDYFAFEGDGCSVNAAGTINFVEGVTYTVAFAYFNRVGCLLDLYNQGAVGTFTGAPVVLNFGGLSGPIPAGSTTVPPIWGAINGSLYGVSVAKSGLPGTADLDSNTLGVPRGTWSLFKDTSGNGVNFAYNDVGKIKLSSFAVTANYNQANLGGL